MGSYHKVCVILNNPAGFGSRLYHLASLRYSVKLVQTSRSSGIPMLPDLLCLHNTLAGPNWFLLREPSEGPGDTV